MSEMIIEDAREFRGLCDHDDAVRLFEQMDLAVRERRFRAAVAPRRELSRRFGYSILWHPQIRPAAAAAGPPRA